MPDTFVDPDHQYADDRDGDDGEDADADAESSDHNHLDGIDSEDEPDNDEIMHSKKKKKKAFKLSLTETENFNEKLHKRGVLYIARIPPKLTPTKIKSLLSEFGEVTRVYLVEEDASVRKRRRKELGRSGGKRYLEGWIEMASKKIAKHLASALNNTPISNQKRNPHYGEFSTRSACKTWQINHCDIVY